ncbi:MAG: cupin domain-containing protein [bacterium]
MNINPGVFRLDAELSMSPWEPMPLVGELTGDSQPLERFHRVYEAATYTPCEVRAGVWEAEAYSEKVDNYPYNEIIFVIEGSISIVDENGTDSLFKAGDCFFLQRGFNGYWNQHETLKIFHMTVATK